MFNCVVVIICGIVCMLGRGLSYSLILLLPAVFLNYNFIYLLVKFYIFTIMASVYVCVLPQHLVQLLRSLRIFDSFYINLTLTHLNRTLFKPN